MNKEQKLEIINEIKNMEFTIVKDDDYITLSPDDDNRMYTYMEDLSRRGLVSSSNHVSLVDDHETETKYITAYEVEDHFESSSNITITLIFERKIGKQFPLQVKVF